MAERGTRVVRVECNGREMTPIPIATGGCIAEASGAIATQHMLCSVLISYSILRLPF